MLEGKTVNLRVEEKEDIDFLVEHRNDINCMGEYWWTIEQRSKSEWMKKFDNPSSLDVLLEPKFFIIQKKDGARIGEIYHFLDLPHHLIELGCWLVPRERKKGYATEANQLIVDYLFLSKEIARIQGMVDVRNTAAQIALEKAGFQRDGTIRDESFERGEWRDYHLYSILRRKWKEPKILTKTANSFCSILGAS